MCPLRILDPSYWCDMMCATAIRRKLTEIVDTHAVEVTFSTIVVATSETIQIIKETEILDMEFICHIQSNSFLFSYNIAYNINDTCIFCDRLGC